MTVKKKPAVAELAQALERFTNQRGTPNITAVADHFDASRTAVYEWIDEYSSSFGLRRECRWVWTGMSKERTA